MCLPERNIIPTVHHLCFFWKFSSFDNPSIHMKNRKLLEFNNFNGVRIIGSSNSIFKLFQTIFVGKIVNCQLFFICSLDCREGHMKKNRLSVCLFASGSKVHHISRWLSLAMNDWNLVEPWVIAYRESESGVGFSKFRIRFFPSMVVPTDEITIFHKVWWKVIEYGESESGIGFSKFSIGYFPPKDGYFSKLTGSHKVWSKVIGYGESESVVSFSKLRSRLFRLKYMTVWR